MPSGFASFRGYPLQTCRLCARRDDDAPVLAPRGTAGYTLDSAHCHWWPTRDRHFLQRGSAEKPDPLSVR